MSKNKNGINVLFNNCAAALQCSIRRELQFTDIFPLLSSDRVSWTCKQSGELVSGKQRNAFSLQGVMADFFWFSLTSHFRR